MRPATGSGPAARDAPALAPHERPSPAMKSPFRFLLPAFLGLLLMPTPLPARAPAVTLDPAVREKCFQILREGLSSSEFWHAMHAAEALTLAGSGAEVRAALEPKLATETDDQRRCGLARELVRAADRDKVKIMLDILASANPHGHTHAAESLYKVKEQGDGKSLRSAMVQDGNPKLRLMAAGALGRLGDAGGMAIIRKRLVESDDPEEYKVSAWLLAIIGNQDDLAPIRSRIKDAPDELTKAYLEHALAALGDAEGVAALARNLRSKDEMVRTYAANFAADGRLTTLSADLIPLLDDPYADARIRAAQALLVISLP